MASDDLLDRGRDSFRRQAWREAYNHLSAAAQASSLALEDLERIAVAAYMLGRDDECAESWARAHAAYLRRGDAARAARCAFWIAFALLLKGQEATGGAWLARARRLLDDLPRGCVEEGYLLIPAALQYLAEGDAEEADAAFTRAAAIAGRFHEPDLNTLAWLGQGQARISRGKAAEGVSLLDEAMVAVTTGEVSPLVAGIVYCAVIEACQDAFDPRRARQWTVALSQWCETQPELVAYRGQCLVHRSEIMQMHGDWSDAMDDARRAGERLAGQPALGMALYQQAELHRLRGAFAESEEAYRQANQWGRSPQPGLSRLRLAQGQIQAASAAIRRLVDEAPDRVARAKLLPAYVEIMLATHDIEAARTAAAELATIAADVAAPLMDALAAQAHGAVLLAEGNARAASAALRRAWMTWQALEAPYEAARVRVLIGRACRQIGDEDSAALEFDAARHVFRQLGAAPELAELEALSPKDNARAIAGLTPREVQVLRLLATGKTNRAIATDLFLSEKTVARHVSNIFTKLGVSTRAAATAYAYEHALR